MSQERIPAAIGRLWRRSAAARFGRPAKLGVDQVVGAAVELADRDGLPSVTLPRVATALGFTKMSLYRHVGSKDELLDLMADFAQGPAPAPSPGDAFWRDRLKRWARGQAVRFQRHPWLAHVPISGPPQGPNQISWMDAGLAGLRDTDLDWSEKLGIVSVLGGYVRSVSQLSQDFAHRSRGVDRDRVQIEHDYGRMMAELVDPRQFPDAAELFASGIFESSPRPPPEPPTDDDFDFGLEVILDGVGKVIDTKAAAVPADDE